MIISSHLVSNLADHSLITRQGLIWLLQANLQSFPAQSIKHNLTYLSSHIQNIRSKNLFFSFGLHSGLHWWFSGKEPTCQCRRHRFDPWARKIPWRKKWQPTPVFLSEKSHGLRSLVGSSPWGCKRVRQDLVPKQQQLPVQTRQEWEEGEEWEASWGGRELPRMTGGHS